MLGYSLTGVGVAVGPRLGTEAAFPFAGVEGIVVTAWTIIDGYVGDVDVSRLTMVGVEERPVGTTRRLLMVDDRADPEQLLCLLDAFQGRLGGPLGELASAVTEDLGYYHLPIDCHVEADGPTLSVPRRVLVMPSAAGFTNESPGRRFDLQAGSAWWTTGRKYASEGWVRCPEHLLEGSLVGHAALPGRFDVHSCTS